jgi:hypothetical protein
MPTTTSLDLAYDTHLGTGIFGNRLHFGFGTCLHTIQTEPLIFLLATLSSLEPSLLFALSLVWLFVRLHKDRALGSKVKRQLQPALWLLFSCS